MADRKQPRPPSGAEQARVLYEEAESRTAKAFEELVAKPSFGALLARSAENVAALTRIGGDLADLVLRNLRLAGRADITRLARQLHRTEDKLERVLQEVEQLRDEVGRSGAGAGSSGSGRSSGDRGSSGSARSTSRPRNRTGSGSGRRAKAKP